MLEHLGPYRIDRILGRGGMGTVYAAVHEETGEPAAVKVLANAVSNDERFRSRFLAEVETLKKLRHPNIVALIGWGEQEGLLFYAMEMVEGRSLQDEMQAGRMFHWQEVVQFTIEICSALKHAHDSGVIHRDLKPANLLLTAGKSIKLTDFGIAKLFGATNITAEGSVIGTADYMAPEQAEGKGITHRTDLYSLGAVMFTLLARRTPFARPSLPQVIHSLKYDAAPPVRQYAPNIPEELELIIDQLLKKEPADRIATALVLSNRLKAMQHALGGNTQSMRQPGGPQSLLGGDSPTTISDTASHSRIGERTAVSSADQPYSKTDITPIPIIGEKLAKPATQLSEIPQTAVDNSVVVKAKDPTRANPRSPTQTADTGENVRSSATHFTVVDKGRSSARDSSSIPDGEGKWKIVAGIAALLVLAAIVVGAIIFQTSADTIYAKIKTAADDDRITDAKGLIDEFLERYPKDARANEVVDWRSDVEASFLKSRLIIRDLKSGGTDVKPFEKTYLEAMSKLSKEPTEAKQLLQSIIDEHGSDMEATPYIDAAKHLIKRLEARGSK